VNSMTGYQPVIGMEVHIELATRSKMFCGCPADHFGREANTQVCPVCLGLPGALPVPNEAAIAATRKLGLALGASLELFSKFDRKNYFYPDLPKGYQISQYDLPFAAAGRVKIGDGADEKFIRIRRVHLEEDTAKNIHTDQATLIDYNRSGVPLMEIVTEPDLSSPEEVTRYLKYLTDVVRYLEISSCDMEKGTMRLEANISVKRTGTTELPPYKVEVKNVNSFRYIAKAITFEVNRHIELLEQGKIPVQETRGFDENRGETVSQRSKEEAQDYRYFPEPDIPPLRFERVAKGVRQSSVSRLPEVIRKQLKEKYGFRDHYIEYLQADRQILRRFEDLVDTGRAAGITPVKIADALVNQRVNLSSADEEIIRSLKNTETVISRDDLLAIVRQVVDAHPELAVQYRSGRHQVIGVLIGAVLKQQPGKINPREAQKTLEEVLTE
jgi:aspartyl-tRNA(Asn)/glutamyl-tRNA(Gln) amidotransferase subunit B